MKQFELCYTIGTSEVLIPQMISAEKPDFSFNYDGSLRFVLQYRDFLPPSVFPRFIVKMHKDIKNETCWRTGVLLEDKKSGAQAKVRADVEVRQISLWVHGKHPREYLHYLRYALSDINNSFEKINVSECVPMIDNQDVTADYETLLKYAERGIDVYFPVGSDKEYSVSKLLGLVQPKDKDELLGVAEKMGLAPAEKKSFTDRLISIIEIKIPIVFATINLTELFKQMRAYDKQRQKESGR
jgi:hypothetical protein